MSTDFDSRAGPERSNPDGCPATPVDFSGASEGFWDIDSPQIRPGPSNHQITTGVLLDGFSSFAARSRTVFSARRAAAMPTAAPAMVSLG